jgi:hypothetical protein
MSTYFCKQCGSTYEVGLLDTDYCQLCNSAAGQRVKASEELLELVNMIDEQALQQYDKLLSDDSFAHYIVFAISANLKARSKDSQFAQELDAIQKKYGVDPDSNAEMASVIQEVEEGRTGDIGGSLRRLRDEYPRLYELMWYTTLRRKYREHNLILHGVDEAEPVTPPGSSPKAGGCFVVTAVYGTEAQDTIQIFRRWRDNSLARSPIGCTAIRLYYRHGPALAKFVTRFPLLRSILRPMLDCAARMLRNSETSGIQDLHYERDEHEG